MSEVNIPEQLFYKNTRKPIEDYLYGYQIEIALRSDLEKIKAVEKNYNDNKCIQHKQTVRTNLTIHYKECLEASEKLSNTIKNSSFVHTAKSKAAVKNMRLYQESFRNASKKLLHDLKTLYILDSKKLSYQDIQTCQLDHNVFFDRWFPRLKKELMMPSNLEAFKEYFDEKACREIIEHAVGILKFDIPTLYEQNPNPGVIGLLETHLRNIIFASELVINFNSQPMESFIINSLKPIDIILQRHMPHYNSEWDHLITSVAWLLRAGGFWHNSNKSLPLKIPYDFIPYEEKELESYDINEVYADYTPVLSPADDEKKAIEDLRRYFKRILGNIETVLNIEFVPEKKDKFSSHVNKPQLRLFFIRRGFDSRSTRGLALSPGKPKGGDILIKFNARKLEEIKRTLIHELAHALGLSHFHQDHRWDCEADVLEHKVSSPPPYEEFGNKSKYSHIYSSFVWTIMAYDAYANIDRKYIENHAHFGHLDYLALLCVYGPSRGNEKLSHIRESWDNNKLSTSDINLTNLAIIQRILPERSINYDAVSLEKNTQIVINHEGHNNVTKDKIIKNRRGRSVAVKQGHAFVKSPSVHLVTNTKAYLDGFSSKARLSRFKKFDLIFNDDTIICSFMGSKDRDAVLFNQDIQKVNGGHENDVYCFYRNHWKQHIIKENDNGVNFVVFYETNMGQIVCRRHNQDLFIIDQTIPKNERAVKLEGYFVGDHYNKETRLSLYSILITQDNQPHQLKSYYWAKRKKYLVMLDPHKLHTELKDGNQLQPLKQFFY